MDVYLSQSNKVIRVLIEGDTELTLQLNQDYVTITYFNTEGKPSDTFTLFKQNKSN